MGVRAPPKMKISFIDITHCFTRRRLSTKVTKVTKITKQTN